MNFNLVSDLHLEWSELELPGGNNLLLAGDIVVADPLRYNRTDKQALTFATRARKFFDEVSKKYKQTYMVMGNHEHYTGQFEDTQQIVSEFIENYSNIQLLEKDQVDLGNNTILWGATLWSDMNKGNPIVQHAIERTINDFRGWIRHTPPNHDRPVDITGNITMAEHSATLVELKYFLESNRFKDDLKIIIMTHFGPCSKSSHPKHGINNPVNFHFYSELSELILNNPAIKVWVHGHTHDSHDYMIGDTRVICNPRGYVSSNGREPPENPQFDANLTFEV
jgi:hypothetical protein